MIRFSVPVRRCARLRLAVLASSFLSTLGASGGAQAQRVLPEVVVSATRFQEPADTLPAGVSVISAEQIQASGATTVNEAVMRLLGVPGRLDLAGGNNYSLDLRGFGVTTESNQVIIVDGQRLNEGDQAYAMLASIAIDAVERVEVLRGTGAVLYGEGATGGAIVVTTKAGRGLAREPGARLYAGAGSRGLRELRARANTTLGGFSIDAGGSHRQSDGHRDNFASGQHAADATVQWRGDALRVGLRAGHDALHSGLPGALTAAQYMANPRRAASLTDYGASQQARAGVFVELLADAWQIVFDANRRDKHYDSVAFGAPYAYDVDAQQASLRARHDARWSGYSNAFVAGLEQGRWKRTIRNSAFTPIGSVADADTRAVYLRNDLLLEGIGTRVSLGWRGETLAKSEGASASVLDVRQNAWELGVSQSLSPAWTVYGRAGRSYRLANVDEFSFTNPAVALRPQRSRDLEAGLGWKPTAVHRIALRVYRNILRDEIGYDPAGNGPFGPFGANLNFDDTRRQGVELESQHALNENLDLNANLAWRQARFTSGPHAGNDIMLVPRRTLALRADWRPAPGHHLNAGVQWVSSQVPDFANACRMPSYALLDLRYAYQWKNAEFALGVANLGDRRYYTQAFGCAAGVTTGIYPEAGRTVTASVTLAF